MMNPRLLSRQIKAFFILAIAPVALLRPQLIHAGQGWPVYAHDSQHSCLSSVTSQKPQLIRWSTPVDLNPQYNGNDLSIHYGSPVITADNTVIVPVKTGATGGFRVEAHHGSDGVLLWSFHTDFSLPPHNGLWTPICGIALTPNDEAVAIPELAALSCCAVSRMLQRTLNHRHASHFMAWITTTRIPRPLGARSKSLLLLPATKMEICTSALFLMASRCLVIQTAFAVVWLALRRTERANSPPPLRCPVIVSSRRWLIIARPHYPRMATRFTWQLIASPSKYALSLPRTCARLIASRFAAKPAHR